MPYQPVFIIGAARSGTNMLRGLLTKFPGIGTWPGDETNFLWKTPGSRPSNDELDAADASPARRRMAHRAFKKLAADEGAQWVIEKTCANSLRVEFLASLFPEARFLFLIRDGRDVACSAQRKWLGPRDDPRLLQKLSRVPLRDVPLQAASFLRYRLLPGRQPKGPPTWGPRFSGIDDLIGVLSVTEVCAVQWRRSVEAADASLQKLSSEQVLRVEYEQFVASPSEQLTRCLRFLDAPFTSTSACRAVDGVHSGSVGAWRCDFSEAEVAGIESHIKPTLLRFGYEPSAPRHAA